MFKKLFKRASPDKIQRAPRIRINTLHDLEFTTVAGSFKLDNISASGLGLIGKGSAPSSGELRIASDVFALELEVIYASGERVGARIAKAPTAFVSSLQKYFETELSALRLKAVNEDYLKAPPVGRAYWFQGDNNCDLSFIGDGERVLSFALTFFGNHIEGSLDEPLHYAAISEAKPGRIKGAELLQQRGAPDAGARAIASRVVNAVDGLQPAHRAALLKFLS